MSHVDYKKRQCPPVEFKKQPCRPVEFKKQSCRPVEFKKHFFFFFFFFFPKKTKAKWFISTIFYYLTLTKLWLGSLPGRDPPISTGYPKKKNTQRRSKKDTKNENPWVGLVPREP